MPKHAAYQDYVIRDGELVGEFEEMYRDHEDPWEQTTRERFSSEKAAAINIIDCLHNTYGAKKVIELGCGFGYFTARIHKTGVHAIGIDISPTAIAKARQHHPETRFAVGNISDHELLKSLNPDIIVMAEITWYVLEQLPSFLDFLRNELPDTYLIHLLMTYEAGVQKYGRDYFTNLDEIKCYFGLNYLESGVVHCQGGGARTWFVGRAV